MLVSPLRDALERTCQEIIETLEYEEAPKKLIAKCQCELNQPSPRFYVIHQWIVGVDDDFAVSDEIALEHLIKQAQLEYRELEVAEESEFGKL